MHKVRILIYVAAAFLISACACPASAQTTSKELGLKTVVIDPGHGGKDPGAPGQTSRTSEKHIVLAISKKLGEKIEKAYPDVKVIYTRSTDVFIGLHERAMVARRNNADLFISVHCNSNASKSAYGSSVHILGQRSNNSKNKTDYFERNMSVAKQENSVILLEEDYQTKYQDYDPNSPESFISHKLQWTAYYESSLLFASEVVDHLIKKPLTPRRAVIDQDIFQVLVETNMPSVLLELAFISNPTEYKYLASASGQEEIAERLFEAFKSYKTKYDASLNVVSAPVETVREPAEADEAEDETQAAASDDVWYGIQIMGLGRRLSAGDSALKGLMAEALKAPDSRIYKYVTARSRTAQEAKSQLQQVRRKFPEAFPVKVTGTTVERVK